VGTALADIHLPVRAGGDLALFQGLAALLLEKDEAARATGEGGPLDHDFVQRHTVGFAAYAGYLRDLDWEKIQTASGLGRDQMESVADLLAASDRTVVCWAMGVTQHPHAVATIKEIVNLCLLQGNVGKPGAGLCPVRGHSNVQGDRTMGIWEKLPPHFGDALGREFGIQAPTRRGHDTVNAIRAMRDGSAHVFVGLGGNFAAATPDTEWTAEALRATSLSVQISTKPNRSHVVHGRTALILPTLGRSDLDLGPDGPRGVTVEDTQGSVHLSTGRLHPVSPHLRSEVAIVCGLAEATLGTGPAGSRIDWAAMAHDYAVVRQHIAHVVPGHAAYEEKVHRPGGFLLPNPARDERRFDTDAGRAIFTVTPAEVMSVPDRHLVLQTLRSHDQFNTTVYGHDDRYRGLSGGRDVVLVHRLDLAALRLRDGDLVDIVAPWKDGSVRVLSGFRAVEYATPRGCAAAYYPETNPLIALDSTARGSNCPTSKYVVVRLMAAGTAPQPVRVRGLGVGEDDEHRSGFHPLHLS
jgi:molybdopterin-dependent oxidoreductase alpha subunit